MSSEADVRWPGIAGTLLSLLGLADAAYLTYEHYTASTTFACPSHGTINCLKVTTSSYSKIHGVPVADLGLVFFAVMIVLQLPAAWRSSVPFLRPARVIWSLVGLGSALYLVWAELFRIDAICEYCTGVHILTFAVFVVTVFGTSSTASIGDRDDDEAMDLQPVA